MRLVEQWSEVLASLPRDWDAASLALTLDDPTAVERTALVLGPAAPVRSHGTFRLDVVRSAERSRTSAETVRRVLRRLDGDGIGGRLEVLTATTAEDAVEAASDGDSGETTAGFAGRWQALVDALPPDWSHALAQVDLDSTDFLDGAALRLSPTNPKAVDGERALRFRTARSVGYGVSPEMARRCFERLDRDRITGGVSIVRVVSEARPVATQGPVWRMGGGSV